MEKDLDQYLIHTYNRSVIFEKGEDVYLYDDHGKKYLDMGAGIAVSALGYSNEEFKQGVKGQIDKLIHISNLYYTKPVLCAAQYLQRLLAWTRYFLQTVGQKRLKVRLSWRGNMLI